MAKAKQPVESHRFKIHCEAESEKLGHILAQLTMLGVENIGYELVTDVKVFGTRPKRDPDQPRAEDFASEWIAKNPTFMVAELGRHFKASGRPQGNANYIARIMTEKGRLRKLSEGHYQSTEIKHIEGPKAKKPDKPAKAAAAPKTPEIKHRTRPPNPTPRFETTNRQLIEKSIRSKHRFTALQIKQVFIDAKRNPHSASPILWHLAKEKVIRIVKPGEYEVMLKKQKLQVPTAKELRDREAYLERERTRAKEYRANKKQPEQAAPVNVETTNTTTEEAANG